jgi:tetratricopeptide (TPR) repeat protein
MKKLLVFSLLLFIIGCGTSHKVVKPKSSMRTYNHEAMSHMIDGAIEDLLGQPKNALVAYHQAAEIDTSSPGIFLAIAENYFVLEESGSAIRMAKKAQSLDPKSLDALELIAACYEKQKKFREAMLTYEQIVKMDPRDVESLYHLTSLQVVNREHDKAFASYQKMVQSGLDDPDYRLRIGNLLFQNRAIVQATAIYEEVNRTNRNYEPGYLALAAVSKSKKDTMAAISWYRKALEQNPKFDDAKAELKNLLEVGKRWDEAITAYRALVEKDSTNLTDKLQLGQFYFFKGDSVSAENWLQKVIQQHPNSERSYLALGALKHFLRDTLAEETLYAQTLQQQPGFLDVRQRLREIYVGQKKWDQAIELYKVLQDNDSTFVGARVVIANLLVQKGDTLQALKTCEALNKDHSDDWRVPFTLARLLLLKSQHAQARVHFDKALALRSDLPGLWILRGVNFLQMDSLKQGTENFTRALQLFPEEPEINYYMGLVYSRQRRTNEAIPYYEKSLKSEPNSLQTMLALSAAYDEVHDLARAEQLYENMIKHRPDLAIVLNNYAYHLAVRNSRLPDALTMALKAVKAEPQNGAYLDTAGWIYFQMGEYEKARELIEQSYKLRNDSAEVAEHLGDVYEKLGDMEKARQLWLKSVDLDENRIDAKQKLKKATP